MVDKEEKETSEFGQKITTEPEPEPQTPTAEEQLATLQGKLDTVEKERDEASKGLKTAHSRLTERDKELKKRADTDTRMDDFELTQRYLIGALQDKGVAPDDETLETRKTDYLKGFDDFVKGKKKERDDVQARGQAEEYGIQARAIHAKAKEAFPDDDVKLLRIERFLDQGMVDDAEELIVKSGKSTGTKENKVESEEDKINKAVDEKLRQEMEKRGMLESEHGGPSGVSQTDAKIMEAYLENSNDPKARADMVAMYNRKGGRL